jgi:hypothetical protein
MCVTGYIILTVEAVTVCETLDTNSVLKWLIARQHGHSESFS